MDVQKLIDELQKIIDKTKIVYFDDEEWGIRKVTEVCIDERFHEEPIVLKN